MCPHKSKMSGGEAGVPETFAHTVRTATIKIAEIEAPTYIIYTLLLVATVTTNICYLATSEEVKHIQEYSPAHMRLGLRVSPCLGKVFLIGDIYRSAL